MAEGLLDHLPFGPVLSELLQLHFYLFFGPFGGPFDDISGISGISMQTAEDKTANNDNLVIKAKKRRLCKEKLKMSLNGVFILACYQL